MTPLPPELKEELQKEYISTFDEKIKELYSALKVSDQQTLENLFHNLAGSGLTYEMGEISTLARKAEEALRTSFHFQQIKKFIQEMQNLFEKYKNI